MNALSSLARNNISFRDVVRHAVALHRNLASDHFFCLPTRHPEKIPSSRLRIIRVSTGDGLTVFTRILNGAHSSAAERIMPMTACLLVTYGRNARRAANACDRRRDHDAAAAALLERRNRRLQTEPHATNVHRNDLVERLDVVFRDRLDDPLDSGVGEKRIDAAVTFLSRCERTCRCRPAVLRRRRNSSPDCCLFPLTASFNAASDRSTSNTFAPSDANNRAGSASDSAGAAGNDRYFVVQASHRLLSSCRSVAERLVEVVEQDRRCLRCRLKFESTNPRFPCSRDVRAPIS